ncbi:hypothetical protein MPUL_04440 [Mycolicibacterium pulveris]|uniref:Uncharacterized protein n=1 Tax=Mycolicibacterium pulveris TaxID=36813 RepID=A0A7I7UGL1_MYCPV|nr:hypothetical protein MPUL_04440 [Mycolicibacterium pulveris]
MRSTEAAAVSAAGFAAADAAAPPLGVVADFSGARVVVALTVSVFLLNPVRIRI